MPARTSASATLPVNLVTGASYLPFGPLTRLVFCNSRMLEKNQTWTTASVLHDYQYKALGQRVAKAHPTTATSTVYYVYDEAGKRLGDYKPKGSTPFSRFWPDTYAAGTRYGPLLRCGTDWGRGGGNKCNRRRTRMAMVGRHPSGWTGTRDTEARTDRRECPVERAGLSGRRPRMRWKRNLLEPAR